MYRIINFTFLLACLLATGLLAYFCGEVAIVMIIPTSMAFAMVLEPEIPYWYNLHDSHVQLYYKQSWSRYLKHHFTN
jgi:hypothetical protein